MNVIAVLLVAMAFGIGAAEFPGEIVQLGVFMKPEPKRTPQDAEAAATVTVM